MLFYVPPFRRPASFTDFSLLKVMFHSFTDLTHEQIVTVIITGMLQREIMNFRTKQQDKNTSVSVLLNVLGNKKDRKQKRKIECVICWFWHIAFNFACVLLSSSKAVLNYLTPRNSIIQF